MGCCCHSDGYREIFELLRAGADAAVNVELSPAYAPVAAELVREAGLDESAVELRLGDFVDEAPGIEPVDVVVMNRVVCCYPDYEALLAAAADRARRYLAVAERRGLRLAEEQRAPIWQTAALVRSA